MSRRRCILLRFEARTHTPRRARAHRTAERLCPRAVRRPRAPKTHLSADPIVVLENADSERRGAGTHPEGSVRKVSTEARHSVPFGSAQAVGVRRRHAPRCRQRGIGGARPDGESPSTNMTAEPKREYWAVLDTVAHGMMAENTRSVPLSESRTEEFTTVTRPPILPPTNLAVHKLWPRVVMILSSYDPK